MSRIENIIDDIERYLDDCKPAAFSSSKIVVNKIEIDELLNSDEYETPVSEDEIKEWKKFL